MVIKRELILVNTQYNMQVIYYRTVLKNYIFFHPNNFNKNKHKMIRLKFSFITLKQKSVKAEMYES